jgi:Ca-activated chloride channel family protein
MKTLVPLAMVALATILTPSSRAQVIPPGKLWSSRALAANVIVPQARSATGFPGAGAGNVQLTEVSVGVEIVEQVATTTLDISLSNPSGTRLEAEMVVPVPDKAVLRGFTFQGAGREPQAAVLDKDAARQIYDSIVAKTRDPALLEFIGFNLIRSSVFPVEARGTQKIRLVYEHVLPADGDRVDYLLPRTESVDYRVPWKVSVRIKSKSPIGTVYSPSHRLDVQRSGEGSLLARVTAEATTEPGAFRLSYLVQREGISASLLAYPDPKIGGGYFLLLAGAPVKVPQSRTGVSPVLNEDRAKPPSRAAARLADSSQSGTGGTPVLLKREVILVLDRSGSMAGEKLEQVRAAALQVLEGLEEGEAFNIVIYHEAVESFATEPVVKNAETMRAARAYLRDLRVRGGTNLHDALLEALRMKSTPGCLPLVLFLTDGLPTIGQTSEQAIAELATRGNRHGRRVFTFGVGVDVNTPLLDKIALGTRAMATYVLPREDVEVKVAQVFNRLAGPVLAAPILEVHESDGSRALGRVRGLLPAKLPDLFEGDQLVLLGQYAGEDPLNFTLTGNYFGRERSFKFRFSLNKATTRNAFVPRLWASRKIAVLTDAVRDLGADRGPGTLSPSAVDPRAGELVGEIVRLSKEFGILTECTAFLAREGTDLSRPANVLAEAQRNFDQRAMQTRSGLGSVSQSLNNAVQRSQFYLNNRNAFFDAQMNRVEVSNLQQVNDRAFYRRGNRWIDSSLVDRPEVPPGRVIEVGSDEFRRLAQRLAEQGRQGTLALRGEILLQVEGDTILVK